MNDLPKMRCASLSELMRESVWCALGQGLRGKRGVRLLVDRGGGLEGGEAGGETGAAGLLLSGFIVGGWVGGSESMVGFDGDEWMLELET